MWCLHLCACAVVLAILFSSSRGVKAEEFLGRIRRATSYASPISYECLTSNNIGGTCVNYSQCPEHSAKSIENLQLHRCFGYRKANQPPIVCCASPSPSAANPQVDAIPPISGVTLQSSGSYPQISGAKHLREALPLLRGASLQSSDATPQLSGAITPTSMRSRGRPEPDSAELLNHPNARLLPTESCGSHAAGSMFTGRTYGRNTTQLGEFPWTVLLKYRKENNEKILCGGALIGDRYVLTAAHCVMMEDAQLITVRIGEYDQSTDPDCMNPEESAQMQRICASRVQDIPVLRTVTPVEYDKSNWNRYYDIAVVILQNATLFNDYVQPICLPFGEMGKRDLTNRRLWIAGWGTRMGKNVRVKLGIDVRGGKHADCAAEYQGGHILISRDKQICAVDRDSCKSDSGGALMNFRGTARGDVWYLHGISSFGPTPCTVPGMSEVYTRVSYYLNWILRSLSAGSEATI